MPPPPPPHHNSQVTPSVYVPSPAPPPRTPISPATHFQPAATTGETVFSEAMHIDLNPPPHEGPLSAEDLRAKVEEAKQLYRAQKDAYRQERARRREKEKANRGEIPVGMQ
jgi:hypothetical protein